VDFDGAIEAHVGWTRRLQDYLRHPDKSLDPAKVARDDLCELGKWIHGGGARNAGLLAFGVLNAKHTDFHIAAADVVRRADRGIDVSEEVLLGGSSVFSVTSSAIVSAILKLKADSKLVQ
jgi:hypothetical protein